jgi:electron-transferring-flavoprotein dehydrogenase
LSGNVFEPRALNELIPDWKTIEDFPIETPVTSDVFKFLWNQNKSLTMPQMVMPKSIDNHGNFIISLGQLTEWMGSHAEEQGVDILAGINADQIYFNEDGSVGGVITGDSGIAKDGSQKDTFEPGIQIQAKQTIFTEGARGSLTERLKSHFKLDKNATSKQHYGLGLKEVWEVPEGHQHFKEGYVQHTVGWPVSSDVYAGSFMYHMKGNKILLGLVVGLDYKNPYLNPYEEF